MDNSNQFSPQDGSFADLEIAIEFQPVNEQAAELLRQQLADVEILESNAFTGSELLTVIVSATRGAIGRVLDFFVQHRQSYKDATVKIGKEEISLQGYSKTEVKDLIESESFLNILRELKKP